MEDSRTLDSMKWLEDLHAHCQPPGIQFQDPREVKLWTGPVPICAME
jgi:hypothetical protein